MYLLFTLFSSRRQPRSLAHEAACGVSLPGEGWRGPLLAVQMDVGRQTGRKRGVCIFRAVLHNERVDDGRREVHRTRLYFRDGSSPSSD